MTDKFYVVFLKRRRVFPYILNVKAKNQTHAKKLFTEDICMQKYARKSPNAIGLIEIGQTKFDQSQIRRISNEDDN